MNGLLEFEFEGLASSYLAEMAIYMIQNEENIIDAMQDGVEVSEKFICDPMHWHHVASAAEDIACTVNLRNIKIGRKWVERATLRVIHYDGKNDVSVLASSEDCKKGQIFAAEEFFLWAKDTSEKFNIKDFFGGLEPASDEETQLFSRNGVGIIQEL